MSNKFWPAIDFIGGGTGALDAIDGDNLSDNDGGFVIDDGSEILAVYRLDGDSGAAESSPDVISPDSNAGTKRWILQIIRCAGVILSEDDTIGTSGLYITFDDSGNEAVLTGGDFNVGTNEIVAGSVNRASGTLTLEIGGTAELSVATGIITVKDGGKLKTDKVEAYDAAGVYLVEDGGLGLHITDSTGLATFTGNVIIPDAGTIGSASITDALQIESDGDIVLTHNIRMADGMAIGNADGNPQIIFDDTGSYLELTGSVGINESAPITDVEITSTAPYISLHNTTEENGDGGRECRLIARGEQDGTEETMLGYLEFCHDSTGDDEKGKFRVLLNDGDDGEAPSITGISIDSVGVLRSLACYSHDMNGETIRDCQINDAGEFGYDSSTKRNKLNIKDIEDTEWIYDLKPVSYNPKSNPDMNRWGLIAEDVVKVKPELVFNDFIWNEEKENFEILEAGVHYKELITPILAELQKHETRLKALEA